MTIEINSDSLVSVIVPTYNRCGLLKKTIDSVLNQRFENIEIIIVDDGSVDNTEKTVEDIKKNNSQKTITYIKQQNEGASVARNRGLKSAKGDLIQFLDDDDILHHDKLARQVAVLENGLFDLVTCNQEIFVHTPGDTGLIDIFPTSSNLFADFICNNLWNSSTVLYRREIVEKTGEWNVDLKIMQDYEFSCRVCMHNPKVGHLHEVLFYYRSSPHQLSISNQRQFVKNFGVYNALSSVHKLAENRADIWNGSVKYALAKRYCWLYIDFVRNHQYAQAREVWQRAWMLGHLKQRIILLWLICRVALPSSSVFPAFSKKGNSTDKYL